MSLSVGMLGNITMKSDPEMDFLKFLGKVQKMAIEKAVDAEVDFRKVHSLKSK